MNRITLAIALAAFAGAVGSASAADLYGTDQVRALAAERLAAQDRLASFVKPDAEAATDLDYRVAAANAAREADYRAHARAVIAYGTNGRDTSTLDDGFEDTLRAAAARERVEQSLARDHALLQSSPEARAALERGLNEKVNVASN